LLVSANALAVLTRPYPRNDSIIPVRETADGTPEDRLL